MKILHNSWIRCICFVPKSSLRSLLDADFIFDVMVSNDFATWSNVSDSMATGIAYSADWRVTSGSPVIRPESMPSAEITSCKPTYHY